MKKFIVIAALSTLFLQQAAAYTWHIKNNNPTGTVRVKLDAVLRPDYQNEVKPGTEWPVDVKADCIRGVIIEGITPPYVGQSVTVAPPSTGCKGYTVEIGHRTNIETNKYTGITSQKDALVANIFY